MYLPSVLKAVVHGAVQITQKDYLILFDKVKHLEKRLKSQLPFKKEYFGTIIVNFKR